MLLCFIDESNKGPFYGFAGVIAGAEVTKALTQDLNEIMARASESYGIDRTEEIHAYPMFHGQDAWAKVGARARVNLFNQIIDAVMAHDVVVLLRSVDQRNLEARQDHQNYPVRFSAEQVCLQHILQRVDAVAGRPPKAYALVIADERTDRDRHRERFAHYQASGTPGVYMNTNLPNLLDTLHFAPSHHSRMLQAADMLAFIYRRVRTVKESNPKSAAAMARLWATIAQSGKVYQEGCWP